MKQLIKQTAQCLGSALLLFLASCNGGKNQTNIEIIQNMMDQESVKAQDWDADRPNFRANMYPPKGAVPVGFKPYKYGLDVLKAEAELKNPLAGDRSERILNLGKTLFNRNCAACHGPGGQGDGPISKYDKLLRPIPSIVTSVQKTYKDGRIFHIITKGQGMMGSYWNQIKTEEERWAVVNYLRVLQQSN